jgi:hypothetical protein
VPTRRDIAYRTRHAGGTSMLGLESLSDNRWRLDSLNRVGMRPHKVGMGLLDNIRVRVQWIGNTHADAPNTQHMVIRKKCRRFRCTDMRGLPSQCRESTTHLGPRNVCNRSTSTSRKAGRRLIDKPKSPRQPQATTAWPQL